MVTEKEFKEYVRIQKSGVVNMYDISYIIQLSGGILSKPKIFLIMKNYNEMQTKWNRPLDLLEKGELGISGLTLEEKLAEEL